jgi:iron complex outermembrane receptor protein
MNLTHPRSLRACASGLALSIAAFAFAPAAIAQEVAETEADVTSIGEIVVTGTSIRGVAAAGSPTVGIGLEELKASGASTISDATRMLPQVLNLGADESRSSFTGGAQDAAANATAVRSANLRGIGPEATLLLINGRRFAPNGTIKALGDMDQIPASALQRVEVVTDGASAIYGSDAVAGVVNLITRRNFDGAETTGRYGFADGLEQFNFSQTFGKTWNGGSMFFAYEKNKRSNLSGADRDFASQDRRDRGGTDARPFTAAPGNIVVNGVRYGLPAGPGTGLTWSQLSPNANRFDEAAYADLLPAQERDTVFLNVFQDINDRLQVWYEGFYTKRDFDLAQPPALFTLSVPNTNPWFVGPPGATAVTVEYRLADDLDPNSSGFENAQQHAVGFNYDIFGDWRLSGYAQNNISRGMQDRKSTLNNAALNAALRSSNPATAFNPFGDGTFNIRNNPQLLDILDANRATYGTNITNDLSLKLDGPLFSVPAGQVRVAVGAEYHDNSYKQSLYASNVLASGEDVTKFINNHRTVSSVYGEVFVPVVSPDMNIPFVRRFDISVAARWEEYSDFGTTSNPKIGLIWSPIEDLNLRATYGTSFRAPSLVDSAAQIKNIFISNVTDPLSATGTTRGMTYNGGNDQLGPETATTWSGGFDWKPSFFDGFSLSAGYYRIDYENRIDVAPGSSLTQPSIYAAYIQRRPDASDVAGNAAYNAMVAGLMGSPDLQNPIEPVTNINVVLDLRKQNLGSMFQDGYDINAAYRFDNAYGDWRVSLDVAKILTVERKSAPTTPWVDVLDTFGNPVDLRVRAGLGWRMDGWSANAFANYTDSYRNTAVSPNVMVDSWTTYDLTAAYQFEGEGWRNGLRVSVNAMNVLDEDPPVVINGTLSWDSQAASAMGRFVSFEVSKSW